MHAQDFFSNSHFLLAQSLLTDCAMHAGFSKDAAAASSFLHLIGWRPGGCWRFQQNSVPPWYHQSDIRVPVLSSAIEFPREIKKASDKRKLRDF
jgi:hypothetical protein